MAPITYWTFEQARACDHDEPAADVCVDVAAGDLELAALATDLGDVQGATVAIWDSEHDGHGDDPRVRDCAGALERCGGQIGTLRLCALPVGGEFWRCLPAWCPSLQVLKITDMEPRPEDLAHLERLGALVTVGLHRSSATASHFCALARGGCRDGVPGRERASGVC